MGRIVVLCTALLLNKINPPMVFKVIPEILFELCSRQKLSMKINKGHKLHKYDGQRCTALLLNEIYPPM